MSMFHKKYVPKEGNSPNWDKSTWANGFIHNMFERCMAAMKFVTRVWIREWRFVVGYRYKVSDRRWHINLRPTGGGGVWEPLLPFFPDPFFQIAKKRAAVFGTPYHTSITYMWKFQTQVTQGQVTRSHQVTSPRKKLECSSKLHRLNDCLATFSDCYSNRAYKIFIS